MNCNTQNDKLFTYFLCVGTDNTGHEWHFYVISGKNKVLFKIFHRRIKRREKKLVHIVTTVMVGDMSKL